MEGNITMPQIIISEILLLILGHFKKYYHGRIGVLYKMV